MLLPGSAAKALLDDPGVPTAFGVLLGVQPPDVDCRVGSISGWPQFLSHRLYTGNRGACREKNAPLRKDGTSYKRLLIDNAFTHEWLEQLDQAHPELLPTSCDPGEALYVSTALSSK